MNKIALRKLICLSIVSIMIPHVNTIIAQIPVISVPRPTEMGRYDNLYQPHQPKTPYMIATPQDARIRKQNEDIMREVEENERRRAEINRQYAIREYLKSNPIPLPDFSNAPGTENFHNARKEILAPNHSYIKLYNQADGWYNVELTSGQFPTDVWIKASGYIHTDAIRNGIYMDTLSLKSTVAICLTDLAEGYQHKYPANYNPEFVLKCCNRTLEVYPNYINALLLKAETLLEMFTRTDKKQYWQDAEKLYAHIHLSGYRKMPEKMYLEWLQSLKSCSKTPYY